MEIPADHRLHDVPYDYYEDMSYFKVTAGSVYLAIGGEV
jgi:hypothetical protein